MSAIAASGFSSVFEANYRRFSRPLKDKCREAVRFILERNIIWGDALTLKTGREAEHIVFSEWSPVNGSMLKRRDFTFHGLLAHEAMKELPLFSDLGERCIHPDAGKEYPPDHFLKIADVAASNYNPDVLTCLANLSSDEVFTPPQLVNRILDLLPADLWSDRNATFLDPGCKSGVFLREIAKRLTMDWRSKSPIAEAAEPHLQEPALWPRHHGVDRLDIAPVRVLLQDRQREVFRLRGIQQRRKAISDSSEWNSLGQWTLRVLRSKQGEL